MKKGQGQLVAFVLLIGFTVVIGVMVGNWMIKQARTSGGKAVERAELDVRCADVSISSVCDGTPKIKNTGYFTITKLKVGGNDIIPVGGIKPNKLSQTLNTEVNIIPFIEIEGKEYGCTSKSKTIPQDICVQ